MKNGKPLAVSYKTQDAVTYANEFTEYVKSEVERQNWDMVPNKTQHFYCDAVFYFDQHGRDCNNYFKVMLDAITAAGAIWLDDDVVCERVQRIYYDADNPRVELDIYPVDYIGIFDDASQLDIFKSCCIGCARYRGGRCSVLNKAIDGKIQDGVSNSSCAMFRGSKHVDK